MNPLSSTPTRNSRARDDSNGGDRLRSVVIPDYELMGRIGSGAYGEVWLARGAATGVLRAIKIVRRETFTDDRPFNREFDGIKKFEDVSRSHPSQLAIFHVGRNEAAGCFYYVMELADPAAPGDDRLPTADRREARDTASTDYLPHTLRSDLEAGRLPAARVLELGVALTEALAHLHSHDLVHRDIKPSNIIFVDGRPKLADIGLVTDASDQCSVVGTEGYIAPEGPGAPQADVFALGKVLYEALTGLDRRRYPEMPAASRDWPDRKLAFELNEILLKACAADARQRYASAEAMLADLRHLAEGRSVKQRRTWQQSRRLSLWFSAATAVVVVGYLGIQSIRLDPPAESDPIAEVLRARGTTNQEAYNAQQMGRFYYGKQNHRQLRLAEDHFKKAIELDPNYIAGYVGLVDTYNSQGTAPSALVPKVRALGEKMVAIAPDRPEGYKALGVCKFYEWQSTEAGTTDAHG
jgi:serine/threonine protein kinase